MLPGPSTSCHWKSAPVSIPSTDEDENGDATTTVSAAHVRCVKVYDDGDSDVVVSGVMRALV